MAVKPSTLNKTATQIINIYQTWISPLWGHQCRFYPSCSEYTKESINRKGIWLGILKGALRILKCHPFHQGGYDPVK